MGRPKKIYCPRCGRKVMTYDGRAQNSLSVRCSYCDKLVTYSPTKKMTTLNDVPMRTSSSGMRFY